MNELSEVKFLYERILRLFHHLLVLRSFAKGSYPVVKLFDWFLKFKVFLHVGHDLLPTVLALVSLSSLVGARVAGGELTLAVAEHA